MSTITPTCLIFLEDNPSNTLIYIDSELVAGSNPLYTVKTYFSDKQVTTVVEKDGTGQIASLEWRESTSDVVHLPPLEAVSLRDWMKPSLIPFNRSVSFVDHHERKYNWKGNGPGEQLSLWTKEVTDGPIARYEPSHRWQPGKKAQLRLAPRATEIQDLVVVSFLFLEKHRRTNENSHLTRTAARGAAGAGLL
ncbi:hypothetical protein SISNIDRAFT_489362 [Sistotremastrum niveocremeum HHB9708]|uniref:DUF6593 domain-containing protein n=1 Tax=Sistotremastrum niveocremeum HHB9708 TaxID=1314777 RepID=A0A164Q7P0_9AGAM|nr:hypothetical protein SISNIDRAFT_489362 [Sistotremastrum niveocremeum HHB9708]